MWFDKRLCDLERKNELLTAEEQKELETKRKAMLALREELDASWRRRMASRTPEEVAQGVIAPGD